MKTLHHHLLTAGLLAGLAVSAVAQIQTPPAPPAGAAAPQTQQAERGRHHGDPAQFRARMEQRMAKRLDALKQKLQITAAQEGAWTAWTGALKPAAIQRPNRAEFARLSTPERIDRLRALRSARTAEMDKRFDATKTFYGTLTADQQKVFDAEAMRFVRGGKGMRGGRHHHHRHHHG